jgi:hypothetical protein
MAFWGAGIEGSLLLFPTSQKTFISGFTELKYVRNSVSLPLNFRSIFVPLLWVQSMNKIIKKALSVYLIYI